MYVKFNDFKCDTVDWCAYPRVCDTSHKGSNFTKVCDDEVIPYMHALHRMDRRVDSLFHGGGVGGTRVRSLYCPDGMFVCVCVYASIGVYVRVFVDRLVHVCVCV